MKMTNLLITVVVVALLGFAWFSVITGTLSQSAGYASCIRSAETNVEARLYEQAIKQYKEALTYGAKEEIYLEIMGVYELLYAEEHTAAIRSKYIEDMAAAAQAYPENPQFWTIQAKLYMEANDLNNTYDLLEEARNRGVANDEINQMYFSLSHMARTDFQMYYQVKTTLDGRNVVFDGNSWKIVNNEGKELTGKYKYISMINSNGTGLYTNSVDTRLMDRTLVPRARFDIEVEEAGVYNGSVDLIAVKMNGVWKYMNSAGEFLPGEFEVAGSFSGTQAVACTGGKWVLLNEKGEQTDLSRFEDIKLDLRMCHLQGDVILAKENGKYHIYNTNFEQVGSFEADNIDICINNGSIAFEQNGLWGYANIEGKVLLEPQFAGAKSFANGYGAVCNEEGLWGFLNSQAQLVIDFTYVDAHYFNSSRTCWVSTEEGTFQLLQFVF